MRTSTNLTLLSAPAPAPAPTPTPAPASRLAALALTLTLATLLLAGPAQAEDPLFAADADRLLYREGADIYRYGCLGCHQEEGRGARGAASYPALFRNPRLAHPSYTIHVMLHGHNAMPPFREMLDDEQVAAVVNYLNTAFENSSVEARVKDVAASRQARGNP